VKPGFSMREALADPQLLGSSLAGDSWSAWRAMLIALMGERLTTAERKTFQQFTGRPHEPNQQVEEAAFVIGRRGGKDRAASILATYIAGLCDHSDVLAPGERGVVVCIAPDQKQAKVTLGYIVAAFEATRILAKLIASRTADSLELTNGITVEVRAASFRRIRGLTALAVIASEAAFWMDQESSSNPDVEILGALRPALATTGGPLILISTPYARKGELWELYRKHYGPEGDPLILVAQGTTRDFNPKISQRTVDRALERDPAMNRAEYLAEWRTDIEAFITPEVINQCVIPGRRELSPATGNSYIAFVDPSGGSGDSMTLAIGHREGALGVLDVLRERRPPFSPDGVVQEFADLLRAYGLHKVAGDRYGGQWPTERFWHHGITYEASEKTKSQIYLEFLPLVNAGRVELLDQPRLVSQLLGLERRTARSGRESIDHSPGAHDDLANAAAGTLVLCAGQLSMAAQWADFGRRTAGISALTPTGPPQSAILYQEMRVRGGFMF
jgi:hypothetical protein